MALENPADAVSACGAIDILSNDYFQIIRSVNRKFNALRRLAELIEQLGDLSGFIPDISRLIPLFKIDLSIYANLKAACPFLDLPALGLPDVNALQREVNAAYARLMARLLKHPWARLSLLEDEMASFQAQFNAYASRGTSFLQCLQAGCSAYQAGSQFFSSLSPSSIQKELDQVFKNSVNGEVKVLTSQMAIKSDQVKSAQDQLTILRQPLP